MIRRSQWLSAFLLVGVIAPVSVFPAGSSATVRASVQGPGQSLSARAHRVPRRCRHRIRAHGVLRLASSEPAGTLNPMAPVSVANGPAAAYGLMFDDLFRLDNHARVVPIMAASIPTIANGGIRADGKTVTIRLKRGLRWSNGEELTSTDFRFGWMVERDPATGPYCATAFLAPHCSVIARVDTPDRHTLVLHLQRAYPALLLYTLPHAWPVSWPGAWHGDPHAAALKLSRDPAFDFSSPSYPTNGPYQVVKVSRSRITFRPMKYYDDMTCGARIGAVSLDLYNSAPAMIAAAATGRADVTLGYYSLTDLIELQRHTYAYTLHLNPTFTLQYVVFNLDKRYRGAPNPLSDRRVRLALALAVNRYQVAQAGLGLTAFQARQIVTWNFLIHTPSLNQAFSSPIAGQWDPRSRSFQKATGQGQSLEDARALLAATHWKHGFAADFYTVDDPMFRSVASILIASWARLGVHVRAHYLQVSTLFADWNHAGPLNRGNFQIAMFWYSGASEPDIYRFQMESRYVVRDQHGRGETSTNIAGIRDPQIDASFERAGSTFDNRVRASAYRAIQLRVNKEAYWLPLHALPLPNTNDARVRHFSVNSDVFPWNAYDWNISP